MSNNQDVFSAMLKATYEVTLTRGDESLPPLTCRYLPFTTLMAIIADVAVSAREEIMQARRRLVDEFILGGVETALSGDKIRETITPIIFTAVAQAPDLARRILLDVVVGLEPKNVVLFSIEDVFLILDSVLKTVDADKVAERASAVFFTAQGMVTKAVEAQAKTDAKETQTSPSPS